MCTFAGQRGGRGDGRHQPRARRPHEPHGVLLDPARRPDLVYRHAHTDHSAHPSFSDILDNQPLPGQYALPSNTNQTKNHYTAPDLVRGNPQQNVVGIPISNNADYSRHYAISEATNHPTQNDTTRKISTHQIPDQYKSYPPPVNYADPNQHTLATRNQLPSSNHPNHYTKTDYHLEATKLNAPINPPTGYLDLDPAPLSPLSMSFSNMMTLPVRHANFVSNRQQPPIEYIPVPLKNLPRNQNHASILKHKPVKPMKPMKHALPKVPINNPHLPAPIGYIPITLDNPGVNPQCLPNPPLATRAKNKIPTKKATPPKQTQTPVEYIPVAINPQIGHPQPVRDRQMKTIHPVDTRPREYMPPPTAPRLSSASIEGWKTEGPPSSFASIDPRKLRTQRVSPLLFSRHQYKPL